MQNNKLKLRNDNFHLFIIMVGRYKWLNANWELYLMNIYKEMLEQLFEINIQSNMTCFHYLTNIQRDKVSRRLRILQINNIEKLHDWKNCNTVQVYRSYWQDWKITRLKKFYDSTTLWALLIKRLKHYLIEKLHDSTSLRILLINTIQKLHDLKKCTTVQIYGFYW